MRRASDALRFYTAAWVDVIGVLMQAVGRMIYPGFPATRDIIIEACAEAAHDAWLEEKTRRLERIAVKTRSLFPLTWPSETGHEQLVPWSELSESVRDFDRIVVGAIIDAMERKGIVVL